MRRRTPDLHSHDSGGGLGRLILNEPCKRFSCPRQLENHLRFSRKCLSMQKGLVVGLNLV